MLTNQINHLSRQIIVMLQQYINSLGFTPVIHFELEGCYQQKQQTHSSHITPDFSIINQYFKQLDIDGKLIPEYWQQQWEYVSLFNGQLPLKEAENLTQVIAKLPVLFAQQGIEKTLIKPVVWAGDKGKLAVGCSNIFSHDVRSVHIPNAIQMNVSVTNDVGKNLIVESFFGEYLQQCFIETSLACSLLYLPEEEAFERFALKTKYGLAEELCSPNDISGGHQGSIALYKRWGKHDQAMGVEPLLYDQNHNVIVSENNWQKTARVEHRLGASSVYYNAFINVIFALLNIIDALHVLNKDQCKIKLTTENKIKELPQSLYCNSAQLGAIEIFSQDNWYAHSINEIAKLKAKSSVTNKQIGDDLKKLILLGYQNKKIHLGSN